MPPTFLYFDLGNVLLNFDHRRACRQLAELAGVDAETVWNVIFASGLYLRSEEGLQSSTGFYETVCQGIGARPGFDAFAHAFSDIFEVNLSMKPVLGQLAAAGHRLGLLSNTNDLHWRFFSDGRFGTIPAVFECVVLSCDVRSMKPHPAIYQAAAERARVKTNEIFYVDDIPANVAGAQSAGFDAVLYTTTPQLVRDLRRRGVRFNY